MASSASWGAIAFCAQQAGVAIGFGFRVGQCSQRVIIGRPIERRIDLIERLAGLHGRAFHEQPLQYDAVDLRTDLRHREGAGAAGSSTVSATGCSATVMKPTTGGGICCCCGWPQPVMARPMPWPTERDATFVTPEVSLDRMTNGNDRFRHP